MLLAGTKLPPDSWKPFMIALICLAPIIMALLTFEFSMYLVQVKNTYFKKQKWFEKGLIVDIVVIVLCSVVAGIITGFGVQYDYTSHSDYEALTYAGIALWWFVVLLGITFILVRILATRHINAKYKLDATALLTKSVSEIAAFTNVSNYKDVINNNKLKNNRWKHLVDGDYSVLSSMIKTLTNNVTKDQVSKLTADCIVFHERYVVSTSAKKRQYVTALFLNLVELLQPVYSAAK